MINDPKVLLRDLYNHVCNAGDEKLDPNLEKAIREVLGLDSATQEPTELKSMPFRILPFKKLPPRDIVTGSMIAPTVNTAHVRKILVNKLGGRAEYVAFLVRATETLKQFVSEAKRERDPYKWAIKSSLDFEGQLLDMLTIPGADLQDNEWDLMMSDVVFMLRSDDIVLVEIAEDGTLFTRDYPDSGNGR